MGTPPQTSKRLAAFIRRIAVARSYSELLEYIQREVRDTTGYKNAWLAVGNKENPTELELLEIDASSSALEHKIRQHANRFKVPGDAFLESIITSSGPVVIVDARTDPRTNKVTVEMLQNRTLINFPLRLVGAPFGLFGVGTFGKEGCKAPSSDELDYLGRLAVEIAVAVGRLMLNAERNSHLNATLVYVDNVDTLRFNMLLGALRELSTDITDVKRMLRTKYISRDTFTFVRFIVYYVTILIGLALAAYFVLGAMRFTFVAQEPKWPLVHPSSLPRPAHKLSRGLGGTVLS